MAAASGSEAQGSGGGEGKSRVGALAWQTQGLKRRVAAHVDTDRAVGAVEAGRARRRSEAIAGRRAQEEGQWHLKPKVARGEQEAAGKGEPVEVWVVRDEDI